MARITHIAVACSYSVAALFVCAMLIRFSIADVASAWTLSVVLGLTAGQIHAILARDTSRDGVSAHMRELAEAKRLMVSEMAALRERITHLEDDFAQGGQSRHAAIVAEMQTLEHLVHAMGERLDGRSGAGRSGAAGRSGPPAGDPVTLMAEVRDAYETAANPIVISGCIGPRGDGYDPGALMTPEEAEAYHVWQTKVLADAGVDLVTAITMTNIPEAIGVARAARAAGVPCAISFTLETDGRLPTGDALSDAIEAVDAATGAAPAYYMINCAHPSHFETTLEEGAAWTQRIKALRANSSRCSHAELDNATELDTGDPDELGGEYADLRRRFPHITVLGGCCGTDHRHVAAISAACFEPA